MEITTSSFNNILELGIIGKIVKKNNIKLLIDKLDSISEKNINLTIFDSKIIPEPVLKKIIEHRIDKNIKIFVFNKNLYSYLYKLSFNVFLQEEKSILDKKSNIKYLAIGGSAGSLEYIIPIVEKLKDSEITIFIVQHLQEEVKNKLSDTVVKNNIL
ncbi:MAG: chemotaxis protein CheB [Candidatus Sericytochromatia bacterium]